MPDTENQADAQADFGQHAAHFNGFHADHKKVTRLSLLSSGTDTQKPGNSSDGHNIRQTDSLHAAMSETRR
jgi:hypothetical protein